MNEKCLSEWELEKLATEGLSLKNLLQHYHLRQCERCRIRLEEVRENMALADDISSSLRSRHE